MGLDNNGFHGWFRLRRNTNRHECPGMNHKYFWWIIDGQLMHIRVASQTITTNITNSMSKEHRNQGKSAYGRWGMSATLHECSKMGMNDSWMFFRAGTETRPYGMSSHHECRDAACRVRKQMILRNIGIKDKAGVAGSKSCLMLLIVVSI